MLEELQSDERRALSREELCLVKVLCPTINQTELIASCVRSLKDGGMGSFEFIKPRPGFIGPHINSPKEYIDSDGVLVLINVDIDNDGNLLDVDLFKVDFSALLKFPEPFKIKNLFVKNVH